MEIHHPTTPPPRRSALVLAQNAAKTAAAFCLVPSLIFLLTLNSCTVGPNYRRPQVSLPATFGKSSGTNASARASRLVLQSASLAQWWQGFHDPQLDRLISAALQGNLDLQIAATRVRQARAQRGIIAGNLFPHVNSSAAYTHIRGSENVSIPFAGPSGGAAGSSAAGTDNGQTSAANSPSPRGSGGPPGISADLYQAGFDMNWELDVFGGTRRGVEAATADLAASVENQRDAMVSVLAEVARNYIELRGAQQRLHVAQENLAAQRQIVELARSTYQSGLTSELDATRAAAQAATIEALIPPLQALISQTTHALSTLLGREPNALAGELQTSHPLPALPPEVFVGLPSELLQRRPDIRRAERQAAAANARIGVAKSELFPKFSLIGSAGLESTTASHLFDWPSRYFLISPGVTWRIFDAGRITSNIALQQAREDESTLAYRRVILLALQETENALVAYATEQTRLNSLGEAVQQARQALQLARSQYEHGLVEFLTVLDAERTLLTAQDSLVQSEQVAATDLVALYKALGGGWETAPKTTR